MSEKQLKSVHITNYYHKNSGGISNSYNRLLEAAERHRRFVRLIVPGAVDEVEEINPFARIYYVAAKNSPVFDQRYRIMLPWNTYLLTGTPIRRILLEEKPDIIEISEKYSLSLLAGVIRMGHFHKVGRPMLVHSSCERMDDNMRSFVSGTFPFMWFSRRVMSNYNFPMFDFHLANSNYTAQEFFDSVASQKNRFRSKAFFNFCWRYFRAPRIPINERIFINPRGVDTVLFNATRRNAEKRRALLAEIGLPADAAVLLYAGRISPEKNTALLPAIMRRLVNDKSRDYRFVIAGDGPKKAELEKHFARAAPGKFNFLGHLTDKDKLADWYANADVFVHPNPREPFGIGPLEAMASETPVVAPNAGGVLTYANNENMWLAEPNAAEFAAAVQNIFADERLTKAKIVNAYNTAQKYTWDKSTDHLFEIYDQMHADFVRRYELFAYQTEPKEINFVSELLSEF